VAAGAGEVLQGPLGVPEASRADDGEVQPQRQKLTLPTLDTEVYCVLSSM